MISFKHLWARLLKRKGWQENKQGLTDKGYWCDGGNIFFERKVLAGVGQKQSGQLLPKHENIRICSSTRSKLPTARRKARLLVSTWVGPLAWSPLSHKHSALSQDCMRLEDPERASWLYEFAFITAFSSPFPCCLEMKRILEKFKETEQWIEKSVLIGCSEEHVPQFALDLGWDDSSSVCVSITFDALRWRCCLGSIPSPCWVNACCQRGLGWVSVGAVVSMTGQSHRTALLFCTCVCKGGLLAGHLTFGNGTTDLMLLPRELPEIVYRNNKGHKVGIITAIYQIKDFVVVFLNRSLG